MTPWELLSDHTVQIVMMGAAVLGIVSGVLGSFAVLRQQSLMGDTLSHAALPGICAGFMVSGTRDLGAIMLGALASGTVAALAVMALTRLTRIKTDAALGAVLSLAFALGIVLLTRLQAGGGAAQAGLESFLFGQAAALLRGDLVVMAGLGGAALAVILLLWKEFKAVAFDPVHAATLGLPVTLLEALLTVMIAVAVVIGLQMVGVVLMTAMIVAPAAAARQWTRRLETMVALSALIGAGAGVTGALISALAPGLATGPLIVLAASVAVAVSILFAPGRGVVWDKLARWREQQSLAGRQVLATMTRLAEQHGDPGYPAEQGMLDAYFGQRTRRVLHTLAAAGLVAPVEHMGEHEGAHWMLTEPGRQAGRRVLSEIGERPC